MKKVNPELLRSSQVDVKYPAIKILQYDSLLPTIIGLLEKGNTDLIADRENKSYVIGSIDLSPLNISKILRYYPLRVFKSSSEYRDIESVLEYLNWEGLWTCL